jgi:hypothetical protein
MLASIVLVGQHLAALVAPGGIADPRGAAAHHHDRLVPGLLQAAQHHDLHQAADMQRGRGGVEADIARHDLLAARGHRAPPRRSSGGCSRARRAGAAGRTDTGSWRSLVRRGRVACKGACKRICCARRTTRPQAISQVEARIIGRCERQLAAPALAHRGGSQALVVPAFARAGRTGCGRRPASSCSCSRSRARDRPTASSTSRPPSAGTRTISTAAARG